MAEDGPLSQADIDALTAGLLGDIPGMGGLDLGALQPEVEVIASQGSSVLVVLLNKPATLTVREIKEANRGSISDGLVGDSVIVRLPINQGLPGEICLLMQNETAAMLCGLMLGDDGKAPYKSEDADALNEFGNQFMGSVCTALGGRYSVSVSAGQAQTSTLDPNQPPFGLDGAAFVDMDLFIEGFEPSLVRVLISPPLATKMSGSGESSSSSANTSGDSDSYPTQERFDNSIGQSSSGSQPNVQMLLDINLKVTIELGRTRLSIRKILELGPGSIIELDRLAGEPVDLLVNDKIVAKGEIVVVDEYFGIRILTLVSPEERIKQLK